ncbi:hypothetical protein Xind_02702 [Xenorhabdus indica]|nr:hypothetical protein [Xenorhabdus indica]
MDIELQPTVDVNMIFVLQTGCVHIGDHGRIEQRQLWLVNDTIGCGNSTLSGIRWAASRLWSPGVKSRENQRVMKDVIISPVTVISRPTLSRVRYAVIGILKRSCTGSWTSVLVKTANV